MDHCVLDYSKLPPVVRCMACGATTALQLPIPITEAVKVADAFAADHRRCVMPEVKG